MKKDLAQHGYATTIGCAQFRDNLMNRVNPESLSKLVYNKGKGGRRQTEYSGKAGRPTKKGMTKKEVKHLQSKMRGRRAVVLAIESADPRPLDTGPDMDVEMRSVEKQATELPPATTALPPDPDTALPPIDTSNFKKPGFKPKPVKRPARLREASPPPVKKPGFRPKPPRREYREVTSTQKWSANGMHHH